MQWHFIYNLLSQTIWPPSTPHAASRTAPSLPATRGFDAVVSAGILPNLNEPSRALAPASLALASKREGAGQIGTLDERGNPQAFSRPP